jgi:DNA modification methylase
MSNTKKAKNQVIENVSIEKLVPYANNARMHSHDQILQIAASIEKFGFVNPVLVDKAGGIIAGHGRVLAAKELGLPDVPCLRVEHLTEEQKRAYILADNKLALNSEWDEGLLRAELEALQAEDVDLSVIGFNDKELRDIMNHGTPSEKSAPPRIEEAEELREKWGVQSGQLWSLGNHLLLCGDCTNKGDTTRVTIGESVDCIITDPPYCSGGFQEAGRSAGSVGTAADHLAIANDRLSTRGWAALLKAAFGNVPASFIYCFTDWRMWVHLFDLAESCGFCVRSMIVWDKKTPGMGRGWRCQHELILWGAKETAPFDKHASGKGNVVSCDRSGNKHHTTEKPIDLMAQLIDVAEFVETVFEPFSGSGTTLLACEMTGRRCRAIELSPAYVAVAIQRWVDATGGRPELVDA